MLLLVLRPTGYESGLRLASSQHASDWTGGHEAFLDCAFACFQSKPRSRHTIIGYSDLLENRTYPLILDISSILHSGTSSRTLCGPSTKKQKIISWQVLATIQMAQHPSLSTRLQSAMHRENGSISRVFLPAGRLHELITQESTRAELERSFPDHDKLLVEEWTVVIFQAPPSSRIVIFAILVLIGKTDCIVPFLADDVTDELLPITIHEGEVSSKASSTGETTVNHAAASSALEACFGTWPSDAVQMFEAVQWSVLAPVLKSPSTMRDIVDSVFDAKTIMPFTNSYPEVRIGGFGEVFKIKIHLDHHNFTSSRHHKV